MTSSPYTIKLVGGTVVTMSERSYELTCAGAALAEREAVIAEYRKARDAYYAASDKADEAFLRHFDKLTNGEPTNAAQASRLANQASYLSADMAVAQGPLFKLDLNPWDIDDADGVERSMV